MVIAWMIAGPTIGTTMDGRAPMVMFWVIAGAVSEPCWAMLDDPTAEDRGAADGGRGSTPNQAGRRSTVRGLAERRQSYIDFRKRRGGMRWRLEGAV